MISLEKWMILAPLQKLPNNVDNLGKIIVATGFELLPKVQKIAQSGHAAASYLSNISLYNYFISLLSTFFLFSFSFFFFYIFFSLNPPNIDFSVIFYSRSFTYF